MWPKGALLQHNRKNRWIFCALFCMLIIPRPSPALIIDHTCTSLSAIPDSYIEAARKNSRFFYGTTSHGTQLVEGMLRIEQGDAKYSFAVDWALPSENNTVCMMSQSQSPDAFFGSAQSYLDANPTVNLAMFSWCGEAYWYDPNTYIAQMGALEAANPKVKFIYMTGHAQEDGCSGCRRHIFNETVRAYCRTNNKILFDFADLDSWYGGVENTYLLDGDCGCAGMNIQLQHPQYFAQEAYHTTFESCVNKGRAVWWMLAKLAGWGQATPVELSGFGTSVVDNGVALQWRTVSESNNLGFNVERSEDNQTFRQLAFMPGKGTIQTPQNYYYEDRTVESGKRYYYRLNQMDRDGGSRYSAVIQIVAGKPERFELDQNYPNPLNEKTEFTLVLAQAGWSEAKICNLLGREVRLLQRGNMAAGPNVLRWDGRDNAGCRVADGIFLFVYTDGRHTAVRRFAVLR